MPKIPFPTKTVSARVAAAELALLEGAYPRAQTALTYRNPFELLIAVILSAQCTDARVNLTTPALFARYPTPEALAHARVADVERIVKSCGFFRMKAKNIVSAATELVTRFGGEVPRTREALESLAGVGRKTASVVMAVAFEEPALAVDTHVFRVAHRLGLTLGPTPRAVEEDLKRLVPRDRWAHAHHWLILHGREVCIARAPRCGSCVARELCPTPAIIRRMVAERAPAVAATAKAGRRAPNARGAATRPRRRSP